MRLLATEQLNIAWNNGTQTQYCYMFTQNTLWFDAHFAYKPVTQDRCALLTVEPCTVPNETDESPFNA